MLRFSLLLMVVSVFCASSVSAQVAPPPQDSRPPREEVRSAEIDAILLLLGAHHQLPPTERFEATSPNAARILRLIARDQGVPPLQRDRALEALAGFVEPETVALWVEVLGDAETEELVRHRLVRLLALHAPAQSLEWVEAWLNADDLQRRLTGAAAAGDLGTAGRSLLEQRLGREENALVRERVAEALAGRP